MQCMREEFHRQRLFDETYSVSEMDIDGATITIQ